ncbi:MAG TPA: efflux RND transporter periplasmic adaptor subunit [Phycisphaerales bacterium]|nr:efflux RND transporter periplasmic adaptor subunit [Phycisphaerales bacterium]
MCAAGGLWGCKPKTNTYAPPPAPEVTVAHPVRKSVTRYLEYTGTTEAYESVDLRARVSGFLEEFRFKPGAAVKKGDLLFVIDPRVYRAQQQQAAADLASKEAAEHLAEVTLARVEEAKESEGVSKQDVDKAIADRDAAKAQTELARAALAAADLNVEFTEVRSPIDGRITKNLVDVGNLVGAGGDPTVLATVVDTTPLYVSVDVSEADTLMVRRARIAHKPGAEPGQIEPGVWRPVSMATSDSAEFNIMGHIDYVDPALNPQTGTIRVRCVFENEGGLLLPGLFVRLRILLETDEATLVPDIALPSDQSGRYALVVNERDTVEIRRVKIGALDGTMRVVTEGLSPTDRMIVNGLQRARPGIVVKPTEQTLPAAATSAPSTPAAPGSGAPAGESKKEEGQPEPSGSGAGGGVKGSNV